jgi:WbqC-like protein
MKLGIMQPYFFPYLGHFALIAAVDEWVVFDIPQYTRKSWINRNRVLHPAEGWQYVSIALAKSSVHITISAARIAGVGDQERYVLGKVSHYRRRAPYYAEVCDIIRSAFAAAGDASLVSLNVGGLRAVCQYLGLPFRCCLCSHLQLDYPQKLHPGSWAPWIAGRLSADTYINPIGGRGLFDPLEFAMDGVALQFLEFAPFIYETPGYAFESNLSILDVLMWNNPRVIVEAIRANTRLVSAPDEQMPAS